MSTVKNYALVVGQSFPPKSKFSVDQIPDLTGRVVIVTGKMACHEQPVGHLAENRVRRGEYRRGQRDC